MYIQKYQGTHLLSHVTFLRDTNMKNELLLEGCRVYGKD